MTGSHAQLTFGLGENFMAGGGEGEWAEMHSGHGLAGGGVRGPVLASTETNNIFIFFLGNGLFYIFFFYLLQIYFK